MDKLRVFVFTLVGCIMAAASFHHFYNDGSSTAWTYIINMDGRGYYAYLPAVFIHDDATYAFHLEHNAQQDQNINFTQEHENGTRLNKYFVGEAVLLSPFFFTAHSVASVFGFETSGYSLPYYISVAVSGVFYGVIGLWLLSLFLFCQFKKKWISIVVPLVFLFGSNLFYYTVYEPSMSHVYSFFLVCAFLFIASKSVERPSTFRLILLGLIIGMIAITRPVNLIILSMLPFILVDGKHLPTVGLLSANRSVIAILLPATLIIGIQLAAYYWQTGHWFVYSYGNEGFKWAEPEIFNTLFSYKRGLFVYAPICLLSLFGLKHLWKLSSVKAISLVGTLSIAIYVVSSWHAWDYGWAYGLRAYVEFLPLFCILLAAFLSKAKPKTTAFIGILIFLCLIYTQIQTHQVTDKILPLAGVNGAEFWEILLRF